MSRRYTRITSLLLDEDSQKTLEFLAMQHNVGKSELIRQMLSWQQFLLDTSKLQYRLRDELEQRKLASEDDFEQNS